MTPIIRLLRRGVYTEHFVFLSAGYANVLGMTLCLRLVRQGVYPFDLAPGQALSEVKKLRSGFAMKQSHPLEMKSLLFTADKLIIKH